MHNFFYSIVSILFLLVFTLVSTVLALNVQAQGTEIEDFHVIELHNNIEAIIQHLEQTFEDNIIWHGNAQIPLSIFNRTGRQTMHEITGEISRHIHGIQELLGVFVNPRSNAQLVFVFANYADLRRIVEEHAPNISFYSQTGRRWSGILAFVCTAALMLACLRERLCTVALLFALAFLFFIPEAILHGIGIILMVNVQYFMSEILSSYKHALNSQSIIRIPQSTFARLTFFLSLIAKYAKKQAYFTLFVVAVLIFSASIYGYFEIYVVLLAIPLVLNILWLEITRLMKRMLYRDHSFFYARSIIPDSHSSFRIERVGVLLISVFVSFLLSIPSVHDLSVQFELIGSASAQEDLEVLRTKIVSILDAHILQNIYRIDSVREAEGSAEEFYEYSTAHPVEILLADRAYQNIFPYISLSSAEGAGQYSNGAVTLTRFSYNAGRYTVFEEQVFRVTTDWIAAEFNKIESLDMLRLYTHGGAWYNIFFEKSTNSSILSGSIEYVLVLLLLLACIINLRRRARTTSTKQK